MKQLTPLTTGMVSGQLLHILSVNIRGFQVFWAGGHLYPRSSFKLIAEASAPINSLFSFRSFGVLISSAGHFSTCHWPKMACGLPLENQGCTLTLPSGTSATNILHKVTHPNPVTKGMCSWYF